MEELRNEIWDYLYRLGERQQIAVIAEKLNKSSDEIQHAVDDPWFDVHDGWVAIAKVQN